VPADLPPPAPADDPPDRDDEPDAFAGGSRVAPWVVTGGLAAVVLIGATVWFVVGRQRDRRGPDAAPEVAQLPVVPPTRPPAVAPTGKVSEPPKADPPRKVDPPTKVDPPKKKTDAPKTDDPPKTVGPPAPAVTTTPVAPPPAPVLPVGEARVVRAGVAKLSAVAFTPDGGRAAFGTGDGRVLVRDLTTGADQELLKGVEERIMCLAFSPDGAQLAGGSSSLRNLGVGPLRVWNLAGARPVVSFEHDAVVMGVAFSPDGTRAVSSSSDTTTRLWDLQAGKEVRWLGPESKQFEHRSGVACVAFSPDGRHVATGEDTFKIFVSGGRATGTSSIGPMAMWVWDAETGKAVCRAPAQKGAVKAGHQDRVTAAAYDPDGRWVATASADGTLRQWDALTGVEQRVFKGHPGEVRCLAVSPDGRYLLSGGGKGYKPKAPADATVRLWEVATGKAVHVFTEHEADVLQVAFLPGGRQAITGSADGTVRVWNLPRATAALAPAADPFVVVRPARWPVCSDENHWFRERVGPRPRSIESSIGIYIGATPPGRSRRESLPG